MHFGHANGYPPGVYRPLFELFKMHYRVLAMRMRPLWNQASPHEISDWKPLASDLAQFLDENRYDRVIGAGHSMGATTALRLALLQPRRFSSLVLIDPVLFPPRFIYWWDFIFRLGLSYRIHPLVRGALRRKRTFEDKKAMFTNYRRKSIFHRMDDTSLQAYVDALTVHNQENEITLSYLPEWEARIYVTGVRADMDIWNKLPSLQPPVLVLRGEHSDTFWKNTADRFQRLLPSARMVTIPDSGHLVPLERPEQVAREISEFLTIYFDFPW